MEVMQPQPQPSITEQLRVLNVQKDRGEIGEDRFNDQKRAIIAQDALARRREAKSSPPPGNGAELMETREENELYVGDKLICTKHIKSGGAEAHQDIEYDVADVIGEHVRLVPESNPHYEPVTLKIDTVKRFFIDAHSEHIRRRAEASATLAIEATEAFS